MNLFRIHRKSKHKIKFKTIFLFIFSLIMTTFAWFAYSRVLDNTLKFHVAAWDMEYIINGISQTSNEIGIGIDGLYPTMDEKSVTIDIINNGEKTVEIDYRVNSIIIAGTTYTVYYEGQQNMTGDYIVMSPSIIETSSVEEEGITVITKKVKGAILSDVEKFPFTVDIEHSYEVQPEGGEGYLKVDVNWIGDNNKLDSEWGYISGTESAMTIGLTIDSYQQEDISTERTVSMPSTTETNPYLPTGFERVAGTTLENGLTIIDSIGNEYVWVEVPKNTTVYPNAGLTITGFSDAEYETIESDLKLYTSDYRNETTYKDEWYTYETTGLAENKYKEYKKKMLKSVYQNGGFYIGKYETGTFEGARTLSSGTSHTAVIQQNAYPYNYVTCAQAETLAENMTSGDNTSSLMFGIQWDLVLKYLETKGEERGTTTQEQLNENSGEWGNYQDSLWLVTNINSKYALSTNSYSWTSGAYGEKDEVESGKYIMLTTGASSTFCKQNIYNLAGNFSEWVLESPHDSSKPSAIRGGNFLNNMLNYSANFRTSETTTYMAQNVGFRVTIY